MNQDSFYGWWGVFDLWACPNPYNNNKISYVIASPRYRDDLSQEDYLKAFNGGQLALCDALVDSKSVEPIRRIHELWTMRNCDLSVSPNSHFFAQDIPF